MILGYWKEQLTKKNNEKRQKVICKKECENKEKR